MRARVTSMPAGVVISVCQGGLNACRRGISVCQGGLSVRRRGHQCLPASSQYLLHGGLGQRHARMCGFGDHLGRASRGFAPSVRDRMDQQELRPPAEQPARSGVPMHQEPERKNRGNRPNICPVPTQCQSSVSPVSIQRQSSVSPASIRRQPGVRSRSQFLFGNH